MNKEKVEFFVGILYTVVGFGSLIGFMVYMYVKTQF